MEPFTCYTCGEPTMKLISSSRHEKLCCPLCLSDGSVTPSTYIKKMAPDSMREHKPKMSNAEYMNLKTRKVGWDGRTRPDRRWR